MIRVRIRAAWSCSCQVMWNASATQEKPRSSSASSAPPGGTEKCTRLKNRPSGLSLPSFWLGRMYVQESPDGRFFMRVNFSVPPGGAELAELERGFSWVAEAFHMTWQLHDQAARIRTLIMVSRLGHCLNDLLFRWKTGSLPVEVAGVVSNHADFAELAASYRIPFRHIPVTPPTKAAAESQLLEVIDDTGADLIVLARYMQILSGEVCKRV